MPNNPPVNVIRKWSDKYNKELYFLNKPGVTKTLILDEDDIETIIDCYNAL